MAFRWILGNKSLVQQRQISLGSQRFSGDDRQPRHRSRGATIRERVWGSTGTLETRPQHGDRHPRLTQCGHASALGSGSKRLSAATAVHKPVERLVVGGRGNGDFVAICGVFKSAPRPSRSSHYTPDDATQCTLFLSRFCTLLAPQSFLMTS